MTDDTDNATFDAIKVRFAAIEKATELQHQDMVRVPTQVDRAVAGLKELLEQKLHTAIEKLHGLINGHISETKEKFLGVGSQFTERDTRTDQRAGDTKLAVDAAFAAAKEATAKIEMGFKEQIRALSDNINTKTNMLTQQIGDLKDRLIAMESRASGAVDTRKDTRDSTSLIIAGLALIIAVGLHFLK